MSIRKQVCELTASDLRAHSLWEFCLDEEGTPGQDEATVKPSEDAGVPGYSPGAYVVATEFTLADGSSLEGYVYSGEPEDFGCIQPTLVLNDGQISFWRGIAIPTRDWLNKAYRQMGKTAETVFPIRYKTRLSINGDLMSGEVGGFGARTLKDPTPKIFH